MKNIVNKKWGSYEVIEEGKKYTVKNLTVEPNGQLSLQAMKVVLSIGLLLKEKLR